MSARDERGDGRARSWHGQRPVEENHIVVALIRERDDARAQAEALAETLAFYADGLAPDRARAALRAFRESRRQGA